MPLAAPRPPVGLAGAVLRVEHGVLTYVGMLQQLVVRIAQDAITQLCELLRKGVVQPDHQGAELRGPIQYEESPMARKVNHSRHKATVLVAEDPHHDRGGVPLSELQYGIDHRQVIGGPEGAKV